MLGGWVGTTRVYVRKGMTAEGVNANYCITEVYKGRLEAEVVQQEYGIIRHTRQ